VAGGNSNRYIRIWVSYLWVVSAYIYMCTETKRARNNRAPNFGLLGSADKQTSWQIRTYCLFIWAIGLGSILMYIFTHTFMCMHLEVGYPWPAAWKSIRLQLTHMEDEFRFRNFKLIRTGSLECGRNAL